MLIIRAIFGLSLVISCTIADYSGYKRKWIEFKKTYNKNYEHSEEEQLRFSIFVENQKKISRHNRLHSLGDVTFKLKSNQFADLTHAEFLQHHVRNAISLDNDRHSALENTIEKFGTISLPPYVDWRQNGSVSEVQSQGNCDSSYANAATGVLESQYQIKTGNFVKFSEQYLLDCSDGKYNNSGCVGGSVEASLKFVSDINGIDTEQSYPYHGSNGSCQLNGNRTKIAIKAINRITPGQEWLLQTAIATIGPISVSFDASRESFQFYSSGIYYDFECQKFNGNHNGLAVGYGTENRLGYYIVRNTFGVGWGEQGYARMARFRNNNCGIASDAIYPSL